MERARAAQADSLEVQGALREAAGGGTAAPRDLQLMAAGFEGPERLGFIETPGLDIYVDI